MTKHKKKHTKQQKTALFDQQYGTKEKRLRTRLLNRVRFESPKFWWRERGIFQKILIILIISITAWVGVMYAVAQWYILRNKDKPLNWGVTFIADYARSFDLNPQETMQAMIDDLGIRRFRLVSYWDHIESQPGTYNFNELDWQFAKAQTAGAKVSLAIGLRQPRWPECHMPAWALGKPKDFWYPKLKDFMTATIERYKNNPALDSYQLENEFFLKVFGECPDFSRDRLIEEYDLVKRLDPNHQVVISRSNNAIGVPIGKPVPDLYGVSIYKRVWDKNITKRYIEYPFPAWFYGFLAGAGEIIQGKDMIVHEMQAEPWAPTGTKQASIEEQDKSLNAKRLKDRIQYARGTGMRTIDLWGAEWWYWRKVKFNDHSIWNVARDQIKSDQYPNRYNE